MSAEWPTPETEQELVRKLVSRDPTATADLAVAYLSLLVEWLKSTNRNLDDHIHHDAATQALVSLMKNPQSYRPELGKSLASYLKMSAGDDLKNLLRRERKHQSGRNTLEAVELADDGGKYTGREIELQEEACLAEATILAEVKNGLTAEELAGLELVIDGERSTDAFAAVLNLENSPTEERNAVVKKFKDKIKARIKRARGLHVEPS